MGFLRRRRLDVHVSTDSCVCMCKADTIARQEFRFDYYTIGTSKSRLLLRRWKRETGPRPDHYAMIHCGVTQLPVWLSLRYIQHLLAGATRKSAILHHQASYVTNQSRRVFVPLEQRATFTRPPRLYPTRSWLRCTRLPNPTTLLSLLTS
jgi:hypothetical protein